MCSASWKSFWVSDVIPRLLITTGEVDGQLMATRSGIMCARVPGMMERCTEQTIAGEIDKPGWKAESNVVEGAVDLLMVAERVMLALEVCGPLWQTLPDLWIHEPYQNNERRIEKRSRSRNA